MATMIRKPPGLLRRQDDPDVLMMICTAGHVDHGKTRLVGLLTGCATDRLQAEKERGLTIELGFAPCVLGDGLCVGIVDVPGHERFVRTMVAGVSGIDAAILVIAADDGVMPQTVEHLQIMELLGVKRGIVALTKIDLASPERVVEVEEAIRRFVAGSFLEGAPICPLSSETGEGIFDFYDTLKAEILSLSREKRQGIFRMPVERTFAQKGFGRVITGIPVSGSVRVGQQVELAPDGVIGRLRGIQRFLRNIDEGHDGQCLALNIPEFGKLPVQRGHVIAEPGYMRGMSMIHARVRALPSLDVPLRNAQSVKIHTGTSETNGTLYLLTDAMLRPGESGLATLVLDRLVVAAPHDRFILRSPTPPLTLAGGEILDTQPGGPRPRKKHAVERLTGYCAWIDGVPCGSAEFDRRRVHYCLKSTMTLGARLHDLELSLLMPPTTVQRHVQSLAAQDHLLELEPDFFIASENLNRCIDAARAALARVEARNTQLAVSFTELQQGLDWPPPVWRTVLAGLESEGRLKVQGNTLLLAGAMQNLNSADQLVMDKIIHLYDTSGFQSPRPDEVPALVQATPAVVEKLFGALFHSGLLIRLSKSVAISKSHYKYAQDLVVKCIRENGELDSADFKYHIQSSRKYALAILDQLDRQNVTLRVGNMRRLATNYEARLL